MAAPTDDTIAPKCSKNNLSIFTFGANDSQASSITTDASLFLPNNLQVTRPVRAWERKPTAPFLNGRSNTRKIWRRAVSGPSRLQQGQEPVLRATTRPLHDSPKNAKRVKRRCVSSEAAVNTQWEVLSSPAKRITTRSSIAKELVALPENDQEGIGDAEQQEEVEGTIIEIINDDGTIAKLEDIQDQVTDEWADEVEFNDTLLHLEDAVNHESAVAATMDVPDSIGGHMESPDQAAITTQSPSTEKSNPAIVQSTTILPTYAIPAGFVSPVRRHRSVSKRLIDAGRRRTLPNAFAPVLQMPEQGTPAVLTELSPETIQSPSNTAQADLTRSPEPCEVECSRVNEKASDEDWEDVELEETSNGYETNISTEQETHDHATDHQLDSSGSRNGLRSFGDLDIPALQAQEESTGTVRVRRSPRRKSSSPVKLQKAAVSKDVSHIIAFTPIKRLVNMQETDQASPLQSSPTPDLIPQTPPSMIKHSDETSHQSKRAERPRLSDDTALLQAFLDRAAQRKHAGARLNDDKLQTDVSSNAIHEALSPPASAGVLLDLDPNVVSPRKLLGSPALQADDPEDIDDETIEAASSHVRLNSRDIRRSERIMTTAPAKITLRGIGETLTSKRTPAQELFLLTGKNTRANKAYAVPPAQRVPQLMAELLELGPAPQQPVQKSSKKKTVTWNKALVYFNNDDPGAVKEDDAAEPTQSNEGTSERDEEQITTIEPLKRRATPGKPRAKQVPEGASTEPATQETIVPIQRIDRKPFRSSIATPIKHVSLAGLEKGKSGIPSITGQLKTRRKMQSRLPAPVSVLETTTTVLPAVQDATSSSIMSPPKKRASLFIPNFDIDAAKIDTAAKIAQAPGLTSPAKKPRRAMVFGSENQISRSEDVGAKLRDTPSLSSPAKKRARRIC